MKCPSCDNVTLLLSERQGIEIDYCPDCRGIWLDRGELDKIIEKSAQPYQAQDNYSGEKKYKKDDDDDYRRDYKHDHNRSYGEYKQHKKKSFLSDLFDM